MKMKIIQQNIDNKNENVKDTIDKLLNDNATEVLFISEFCYYKHEVNIKQVLESLDYEIIMPLAFKKYHEAQPNYNCVCMLAKKKGISFSHLKMDKISCDLRYIAGKINYNDDELNIFLCHAPQGREEEKMEMINAILDFLEINKWNSCFVGGDFNIDGFFVGKTSLEREFQQLLYTKLYDTDLEQVSTWKNERLDFALVTKDLKGIFSTIPIETKSDHKALKTVSN